jgi:uncharacterized protein
MKDNWIQTYTGRKFHLFDPQPDEICIEDIAHALAMQCRFAGHTRFHFSIAQHCYILSLLGKDILQCFQLLMHDASEAYLVDVPRPLKPDLTNYYEIEDRIMTVIAAKFGFDWPMTPEVKRMDTQMLFTERNQLLIRVEAADWMKGFDEKDYPAFPITLPAIEPFRAEQLFLSRFTELYQ